MVFELFFNCVTVQPKNSTFRQFPDECFPSRDQYAEMSTEAPSVRGAAGVLAMLKGIPQGS